MSSVPSAGQACAPSFRGRGGARRRVRAGWGSAGLVLAVLLAGCSSDAGAEADPTAQTSQVASSSTEVTQSSLTPADPITDVDATDPASSAAETGEVLAIGETADVLEIGAAGDDSAWQVTVTSVQWVTAKDVHGDYSDGWVPSAKVYLAAEVEYVAGNAPLVFSSVDWSFTTSDGANGVLNKPGGGAVEIPFALEALGELGPGESSSGRVYFGLPVESGGVINYATATGDVAAQWAVTG